MLLFFDFTLEKERSNKKKWVKTVQILAAYLVAAWTFLQFIDWILNRYNISPYWVDILLWFFVGIIPSLVIYLYHQDRINQRILKLREKIIIPLNFVLLLIALYFSFGSSDLGATTKEIKYTDEAGLGQSKTITKEEFRIGVPVYGFENLSQNDSIDWMEYGIGRLLVEDLVQNKSISPDFSNIRTTSSKIEEASLFNNFYIDGNYQKRDGEYTITVFKRKATNGKILAEKTVTGRNFLPLIDELTLFVIENSGFIETQSLRYLDYPINEFMSNSVEAIREFIDGNYSEAIAIDDKFAMAYLEYAKRSLRLSRGKLQVQDLADKAFQYRGRLPLQKQLEVNIQRNLAYEQFDDAAEQVRLQLEVDPHNDFYNQVLFGIYGETRQTTKYAEASERLFEIDPNSESGMNLAIAAMVDGRDDDLIAAIKKFELISPNLKVFRLQPLLLKGEIKKAEALLEEVKESYPGWKNKWQVYDTAVQYLKQNQVDLSKLKRFEGTFRFDANEQTYTYWIEDDRLIQFINNQYMHALIPADDYSVINGFVNDVTWKRDLVFDENDKVVGIKVSQYDYSNTYVYWLWKEDATIQKAHDTFEKGDLAEAERLYQQAFTENPQHVYLENHLKYIAYKDSIGDEALLQQNKGFAGQYGQRLFWIEDGKFFYKRQGKDIDLPRFELLAIDENRYMDVTRANTLMEFVIDSTSGKLASSAVQYRFDTKEWALNGDPQANNYFLKDD